MLAAAAISILLERVRKDSRPADGDTSIAAYVCVRVWVRVCDTFIAAYVYVRVWVRVCNTFIAASQ